MDDDDFAAQVEGKIEIPQTGWYQIGFNSDDGGALRIPGQTWDSVVADGTGNAAVSGYELRNDSLTGWSFTAGKIYLTAGQHPFVGIMFERGGGSFFEMFGRGYAGADIDPAWSLLVRHGAGFRTDDKDGLELVSGTCPAALMGDVNKDCVVNLMDFAEMAANWLLDCYQIPNHPSCQAPGHPGPDFVRIPGGTFEMGDSFNEGDTDELPVHTVLVDPFYMGKYEVTNQQYCDFLNSAYPSQLEVVGSRVHATSDTSNLYWYLMMDAYSQITYNGSSFAALTKSGHSMGNDPMVCVSWYGAAAYCNWRSQQEGREPCYNLSTWECDFSRKGYRLPTEAEWEYAARGGLSGRRFPWGDLISHARANYWSSTADSYDVSPTREFHPDFCYGLTCTSPVGSFAPNGYGLYDMAGNVCEWCNDWYSDTCYTNGPQINPTGPATSIWRVQRGGSSGTSASGCRVASRGNATETICFGSLGFRLVLNLD